MEEGGPVWSEKGGSSFGVIYREDDQAYCQFDSGKDFVSAGAVISAKSAVGFALGSAGAVIPFTVQSQRMEPWDNGTIPRPLFLRMGQQGQPYAGFAKFAGNSPDVPGRFIGGVNVIRDFWDQNFKRWSRQVFQASLTQDGNPDRYGFFQYTEAEGRSGPQPGAVCWPSL
jgi:hypothetical protein